MIGNVGRVTRPAASGNSWRLFEVSEVLGEHPSLHVQCEIVGTRW